MSADRWIKFEEDVEEGGERWSKPHVATLSLHSLFELRKGISSGTVLLDMNAVTLYQIFGMHGLVAAYSFQYLCVDTISWASGW